MNILIVEDNADDRRLLRCSLEHHGCTVIEARDGEEGLDLAIDPGTATHDCHTKRLFRPACRTASRENRSFSSTATVTCSRTASRST